MLNKMTKLVLSPSCTVVVTSNKIYFSPDVNPEIIQELDNDKGFQNAQFSMSYKFFGLLYADKKLVIWKVEGRNFTKFKVISLKRCSSSFTFDHDETKVIVADRCGNVYIYDILNEDKSSADENESKENTNLPVIGHISMLLDVACTRDYVITCDRDEKIRVSLLNHPYVIESFCLGHTEFVCKIFPVCNGKNLVSTSGDGSLKMWELATGKELDSFDLMSDNLFKTPPTILKACNNSNLVVVSCVQSSAFRVFSINGSNLSEKFTVDLTSKCMIVDCCFKPSNSTSEDVLLVLSAKKDQYFLSEYVFTTSDWSTRKVDEVFSSFASSINFSSADIQQDVSSYYKNFGKNIEKHEKRAYSQLEVVEDDRQKQMKLEIV